MAQDPQENPFSKYVGQPDQEPDEPQENPFAKYVGQDSVVPQAGESYVPPSMEGGDSDTSWGQKLKGWLSPLWTEKEGTREEMLEDMGAFQFGMTEGTMGTGELTADAMRFLAEGARSAPVQSQWLPPLDPEEEERRRARQGDWLDTGASKLDAYIEDRRQAAGYYEEAERRDAEQNVFEKYVRMSGSGLVTTMPIIAGSAVNPALGLGAAFGMAVGDMYGQQLEAHPDMTPEERQKAAGLTLAASPLYSLMEYAPIGRAFGRAGTTVPRRMIVNAISTMIQEGATEGGQSILSQGLTGEDINWEQVRDEAIVGGVLGLGLGGGVSVQRARQELFNEAVDDVLDAAEGAGLDRQEAERRLLAGDDITDLEAIADELDQADGGKTVSPIEEEVADFELDPEQELAELPPEPTPEPVPSVPEEPTPEPVPSVPEEPAQEYAPYTPPPLRPEDRPPADMELIEMIPSPFPELEGPQRNRELYRELDDQELVRRFKQQTITGGRAIGKGEDIQMRRQRRSENTWGEMSAGTDVGNAAQARYYRNTVGNATQARERLNALEAELRARGMDPDQLGKEALLEARPSDLMEENVEYAPEVLFNMEDDPLLDAARQTMQDINASDMGPNDPILSERMAMLFEEIQRRGLPDDTVFEDVGPLWHGTGADRFDRFTREKIGTGEGAAAYGRGLYFAEAEAVAREYRKRLARNTRSVQALDQVTVGGLDADGLYTFGLQIADDRMGVLSREDIQQMARGIVRAARNVAEDFNYMTREELATEFTEYMRDKLANIDAQISSMESVRQGVEPGYRATKMRANRTMLADFASQITPEDFASVKAAGSLYEVMLRADEEQFIDYDAQLWNQPPHILELLGIKDIVPDYYQAIRDEIKTDISHAQWEDAKSRLAQAKWDLIDTIKGWPKTEYVGNGEYTLDSPLTNTRGGWGRAPQVRFGQNASGKWEVVSANVTHVLGQFDYLDEAVKAQQERWALRSTLVTGGDLLLFGEDLLEAKGIKGLRYLDAMSRGHGEGTRNYVVFDDEVIDIVSVSEEGQQFRNPYPEGGNFFVQMEKEIAQGPKKLTGKGWHEWAMSTSRTFKQDEWNWTFIEQPGDGLLDDEVYTREEVLELAGLKGVELYETVRGDRPEDFNLRERLEQAEFRVIRARESLKQTAFVHGYHSKQIDIAGYPLEQKPLFQEIEEVEQSTNHLSMIIEADQLPSLTSSTQRFSEVDYVLAYIQNNVKFDRGFEAAVETGIQVATEMLYLRDHQLKAAERAVRARLVLRQEQKQTGPEFDALPSPVRTAKERLQRLEQELREIRDEVDQGTEKKRARYASLKIGPGIPTNYREILIQLKSKMQGEGYEVSTQQLIDRWEDQAYQGMHGQFDEGEIEATVRAMQEDPLAWEGMITRMMDRLEWNEEFGIFPRSLMYMSPHWEERDVLIHIRLSERPDGTLLIEEIQSDWHQQGREEGYKDLRKREATADDFRTWLREKNPADAVTLLDHIGFTDQQIMETIKSRSEMGVRFLQDTGLLMPGMGGYREFGQPSLGPFRETLDWVTLAMKRVISEAVRTGATRLALPTGAQVARMEGVRNFVDTIEYYPALQYLEAFQNGENVIRESDVNEARLRELLNDELADRLLEQAWSPDLSPSEENRLGVRDDRVEFARALRHYIDDPAYVDRLLPDEANTLDLVWTRMMEDEMGWEEATRDVMKVSLGPRFDWVSADWFETIRQEILDQAAPVKYVLQNEELEYGGEGMVKFYDKIVTAAFSKAAKHLGLKKARLTPEYVEGTERVDGFLEGPDDSVLPDGYAWAWDDQFMHIEPFPNYGIMELSDPEAETNLNTPPKGKLVGWGKTKEEAWKAAFPTKDVPPDIDREGVFAADTTPTNLVFHITPDVVEKVQDRGFRLWDEGRRFQRFDEVLRAASVTRAAEIAQGAVFDRQVQFRRAIMHEVQDAARAQGINLQDRTRDVEDFLVEAGVQDAFTALEDNANAIGWYDRKVKEAWAVLELMHPEVSDPNQRALFQAILAITSSGLRVNKNFQLAEKIWTTLQDEGYIDTGLAAGTNADTQRIQLEFIGNFYNQLEGLQPGLFRRFMDSQFRVRDLERLGFDLGDELKDAVVPGSRILGPKIGGGFFANLSGNFDELTQDRWFTRTFRRWRGETVKQRQDLMETHQANLYRALRQNRSQRLQALLGDHAEAARAGEPVALHLVALHVSNESTKKEYRAALAKYKLGPAIRKSSNNYTKHYDGILAADHPGAAGLRAWRVGVMRRILERVQEQHPDMTMADLQALYWYMEKRLYEQAGQKDEGKGGYDESEAPDYSNAAQLVAREAGFTEEQIREAIEQRDAGLEGVPDDAQEAAAAEPVGVQELEGLVGEEGLLIADEGRAFEADPEAAREARARSLNFVHDAYHGTTFDFDRFDPTRSFPDNYYGPAIYSSSSPSDVGIYYATPSGPDIQGRVSSRQEEIFQELELARPDLDYDQLSDVSTKLATQEQVGPTRSIMPVKLRIENPVFVDQYGGTVWELEYEYEEIDGYEEVVEYGGPAMQLLQALTDALQTAVGSDVTAGDALQQVQEAIFGDGAINAAQFEEIVRENIYVDFHEIHQRQTWAGELIAETYQLMGYDGVIMRADQVFPHMQLPDDETYHYVVFDPKNVRSRFAAFEDGDTDLLLGDQGDLFDLPERQVGPMEVSEPIPEPTWNINQLTEWLIREKVDPELWFEVPHRGRAPNPAKPQEGKNSERAWVRWSRPDAYFSLTSYIKRMLQDEASYIRMHNSKLRSMELEPHKLKYWEDRWLPTYFERMNDWRERLGFGPWDGKPLGDPRQVIKQVQAQLWQQHGRGGTYRYGASPAEPTAREQKREAAAQQEDIFAAPELEGPEAPSSVERTDLFGEAVEPTVTQDDLFGSPERIQGMKDALRDAKDLVRRWGGPDADQSVMMPHHKEMFNEALSLIRRSEGKGLIQGEIKPAEKVEPRDDYTLDMFGEPVVEEQGELWAIDPDELGPKPTLNELELAFGPDVSRQDIAAEVTDWVLESGLNMSPEARMERLRLPEAISIKGLTIRGPVDAAKALQPLRNGQWEVLSVLVFKGDTPLAHIPLTSGAIDHVTITGSFLNRVGKQAKALGADSIVFAHNHPSGRNQPSGGDIEGTRIIAGHLGSMGIQLRGHIVLNHNRFSWIMPDGTWVEYVAPEGEEFSDSPWLPDTGLHQLVSVFDVARMSQKLAPLQPDQAFVYWVDAWLDVVAGEIIHPESMRKEWIEERRHALGAQGYTIVMGHEANQVAWLRALNEFRRELHVKKGHRDLAPGHVVRLTGRGTSFESMLTWDQNELPKRPSLPSRIGVQEEGLEFEQETVEATELEDLPLDVQERALRTAHGAPSANIVERGVLAAERLRDAFKYSTKYARDSVHREVLREFKSIDPWAESKAIHDIDDIIGPIKKDREALEAFEWSLVLPDLIRGIEEGEYANKELPFEFESTEQVESLLAEVEERVRQNPLVREALARRAELNEKVKRALVEEDLLSETVMEDDRYFHRQVIEYLDVLERARDPQGIDARLKQKGFQRARVGSSKDWNTAYHEAEFEWLSQAYKLLRQSELLQEMRNRFDVINDMKRKAKRMNLTRLGQMLHERQPMTLEEPMLSPTELVDAFLKPYAQRIAMSNHQLAKLAAQGELAAGPKFDGVVEALADAWELYLAEKADEAENPRVAFDHPLWFQYLSWLAGANVEGSMQAAVIFKAIREREESVKSFLGDDYIEWHVNSRKGLSDLEALAGEDYVQWQPEKGNRFFQAATIQEQVVDALLQGMGFTEDMVRQATIMGGPRETWLIPRELADELNHMVDPPNLVERIISTPQTYWKQYILMAPHRFLKYNMNNMFGDADAAFAGNPRILLYAKQAFKDLAAHRKNRASPELRKEIELALKYGVIESGFSGHEVPDVSEHILFQGIVSNDVNVLEKTAKAYFRSARDLTTLRENIMRLAAWRHYLALLNENPDVKVYGASKRHEIDEMRAARFSRERVAAKLARELIGDYANISLAGQYIRRNFIPFWSWMEINAPRYYRLFQNAGWDETVTGTGHIAKAAGARIAVGTSVMSVRVAAFYALVQLGAHLLFPDDDDLPEEVQEAEKAAFRRGRGELHVPLPWRTMDGNIRSVRMPGAASDVLEWAGLQDLPQDIQDIRRGRLEWYDPVLNAPKSAFNRLVQGVRPEMKLGLELVSGSSYYPSIFLNERGLDWRLGGGRPIRDRWQHFFSPLPPLDRVVQKLKDVPNRIDDPIEEGLHLFTYSTDPREQSYWEAKRMVREYRQEIGELSETRISQLGSEQRARSNALYYYKRARTFGQEERAERWLQRYREHGGTAEGLAQSERMAHPTYGLDEAQLRDFLATLDETEQGIVQLSRAYYRDLYGR